MTVQRERSEKQASPADQTGAETSAPVERLTGKAATQERILSAATELFLSRGYENTTIAQVAERAEVSRATVFWHFSDKESLFRECFNRICEPFRISLTRDFSSLPPEKRLREQVGLYESFVAEHRANVDGFILWAMEHTNFRDWLIRTLLDLHQRFGGALTESISAGASSRSQTKPSIRARIKPWRRRLSKRCRCSPLRPLIIGASNMSLVFSGMAKT